MQKQQRNSALIAVLVLSLVLSSYNAVKKGTITFISADGLTITADEYIVASDSPYILLFHEQESSRGEFHTIARRLNKMDYNCLAVDLRNGGNNNFVSNQTAKRCRESRCPLGTDGVELDIKAAIEYAFSLSNQPVILLGSGANGSLSLKVANENDNVRAVVALSPGEYFIPNLSIQDTITHLKKPIFITSSLLEFPYVAQLVSNVDKQYVTLFEPKLGDGGRGAVSLSSEYDYNSEYWFAILLFFKELI